jgi:hypothetical protein
MARILFLHSGNNMSTFVKKDLDILRSCHDVRLVHVRKPQKWLKEAAKCDIIFTWFADLGGFIAVILAKLFRKKAVVVAGGNEMNHLYTF